ncbi:hypothetical protein FISHEDRAFT_62224 [Fistulina hepatica ATCC 64428]|nr:hypothetical protein FISHEDRAFT_62224 [Fistulina hepatica ATCC 64428]
MARLFMLLLQCMHFAARLSSTRNGMGRVSCKGQLFGSAFTCLLFTFSLSDPSLFDRAASRACAAVYEIGYVPPRTSKVKPKFMYLIGADEVDPKVIPEIEKMSGRGEGDLRALSEVLDVTIPYDDVLALRDSKLTSVEIARVGQHAVVENAKKGGEKHQGKGRFKVPGFGSYNHGFLPGIWQSATRPFLTDFPVETQDIVLGFSP